MNDTVIQVLLIDLENCPSQIEQLMTDLEKYSSVVVCYAKSGAKVPVDWILPLTTTINNSRLKLLKMPEVGKNSADFGIAFWAGVLMAQLPEQAHFDIVSNDTDLDYVVSLLASEKRSANRIGIKKEKITSPEETKLSTNQDHYLIAYCVHLLSHSNKPAKKDTLLNSINSKFKADNIDATKIFEMLVKNSVITLNGNKVSYNQENLTNFATHLAK